MAMGHVILREFHLDRQAEYFEDYCRRKYTDMPMLVRLVEQDGAGARPLAARLRFRDGIWASEQSRLEDGRLSTRPAARSSRPNGSIGFRWGEQGKWNLEEKSQGGRRRTLR
jgi:nitrate reductase alpha subunit